MGFVEFISLFAKDGPLWVLVAAFVGAGLYLGKWNLDREKEERAERIRFNNKMLEHLDKLNNLIGTLQGAMQVVANAITLQEREFEELKIIVMEIRSQTMTRDYSVHPTIHSPQKDAHNSPTQTNSHGQ